VKLLPPDVIFYSENAPNSIFLARVSPPTSLAELTLDLRGLLVREEREEGREGRAKERNRGRERR